MKRPFPTAILSCLAFALVTLLAATSFTSCGNDDPAPLRPSLPSTNSTHVRTITRLGSVESGYDWQFTYAGGRLTQAVGTLREASPQIARSFSYTSRLAYKPRAVTMNTSSGENVKLHLNMLGLIDQMTVNRNVYTFSYDANGRLITWTKTVFEESLGQAQQYNSSAVIAYTPTGALNQITYNGTDSRRVILTFTSLAQANVDGLMPPTISQEMGILGYEQLFYAGLLGKAPAQLVQSVTREYPDAVPSAPAAITTFEYGFHNGSVTLCNYHLADGAVASVSYTY